MDDPINVLYSMVIATISTVLMDDPINVLYSTDPATIATV
jgi:hypothetical protein